MWNKIMNNSIIGFIFGILITAIVAGASILTGETLNVGIFSGLVGIAGVAVKEVINFISSGQFNKKTILFGIIGAIVATVALIIIL